jgi:hypothetical protein
LYHFAVYRERAIYNRACYYAGDIVEYDSGENAYMVPLANLESYREIAGEYDAACQVDHAGLFL